MKDRYVDDFDDSPRVTRKPRNPHVKELFDGTYKPKREEPKKKYKDDYDEIVDEEEHLLDDDEPLIEKTDEEEQNWREYLEAQNVNTQGGKLTPDIQR